MRISSLFAAVLIAVPAIASAQTAAPAPAAPTTAAPSAAIKAASAYNTTDTDLGTLLDDPAAKAVLVKRVPALVGNEQISMARGMTLRSLQQYAGDMLTDDALVQIDADLAKVPVKK